jgi:tetratricopeptide (TPR) repeat protein
MKDSASSGALNAPAPHPAHPHTVAPQPAALSFVVPVWARYLIGAFIVGFVSYMIFITLRQRSIDASSDIWYRLDSLNNAEALKEFAARSDVGIAGQVAQFKLAREDLRNGLRDFATRKFAERKAAENPLKPEATKSEPILASIESLTRAAKSYGELSRAGGLPKLLEIEANLGAAKANEALGTFTEAKAFYEKVVTLAPDTDMAAQAKAGIERLTKNAAEIKAMQEKLLNAARGTRS